jgi:hypothetical protein
LDSVLRRPTRWLSIGALAVAACGGSRAACGQDYRIDPLASELHVLVYRAGPVARLGHNHVIAARDIAGHVTRAPTPEGSSVEIRLPVEGFTVDAPELRARYGADFSSTPSARDVAGTTANMLGGALLDATAYPQIRIVGVLRDGLEGYVVDAAISVKSTVWRASIPIELEIADDVLVARGSTEITHDALGLTPLSVMLGALRVAETVDIRFALTARRATRD